MELEEIIKISRTRPDVLRYLKKSVNGRNLKWLSKQIEINKYDISHFITGSEKNRKYPLIEKICPICKKIFITSDGAPREKITCSYGCSNSWFRRIRNKPKKYKSYRTICFYHHKKECVVCGEIKIVSVHHFDENRQNNSPENLIPLCPTHHQYWHSRYRKEIEKLVIEFREKFINRDVS